jgi:hypothetical protein
VGLIDKIDQHGQKWGRKLDNADHRRMTRQFGICDDRLQFET